MVQIRFRITQSFLLFVLLFGLASADMFAQGFSTFNNRNHPYLEWQVAETAHFKIIYPSRLAGIEIRAAAIAEEAYTALSQNLEITSVEKIRIYLSDEDEVNNGFASPVGKGHTNIWVNLNDYAEIWTGREKWLRKVIAHELAHIFHFKSIWTHMGLLQYMVADPIPVFWAEGIAQYQTESWDSQRGDRWLRKAIFDSRPGYRDGQSFDNRRLLYASGNSQVRYFTEKYGDSSLVNLLGYRDKLFGLLAYHDFNKAFKTVVDGGYEAFYEDWRKHMNIYYNTLASSMERVDSLDARRARLPGQAYLDMALSPGDSLIAVLSLPSFQRPVQRLYVVRNDSAASARRVAEGSINPDLSWSRDGKTLYYSRTVRGERSSLVNDIYRLDTDTAREERVTFSRRARYPAAGPGRDAIGYIVNENGTGNLFVLDLNTREETRITEFSGDVQLLWPVWVENRQRWLLHRFDAEGNRNMILVHPESGEVILLDDGGIDNRKFVLSPDGNRVAYTSLRDEVPNVFIYDLVSAEEKRVTNLFTGGEVFGWMAESDTAGAEKLLIKASEAKRRDYAWWADAERGVYRDEERVPDAYAGWREKQPPVMLPSAIPPDETLITERYRYNTFKNITHAASFALPYYAGTDNWGVFAITNWMEPLGKHLVSALGWVSFQNTAENSFGMVSYLNNQFYPAAAFSLYRIPGESKFYGNRFLMQQLAGGEISLTWPLDVFERPYQHASFGVRFRHLLIDPVNRDRFTDIPHIPRPEKGRQADLRLDWALKKQRPWRDNSIHPLDGRGIRTRLMGAEKVLGSEVRFLLADVQVFTLLPSAGRHRFYLYGRYQQQWGKPLPQNYIGFSRYDNITVNLPDQVFVQFFQDSDRVRGYRDFASGKRVLFGSLEYRMPFLPSLQTTLLGVLDLGTTSFALFTDAGVVWSALLPDGARGTENRWGAGAEIKNEIRLFGLRFAHALGVARPAHKLFSDAGTDTDLYYRVRAVVPF